MSDRLLQVEDLRVEFWTNRGTVHAVNGISFDVAAGETLGIVGESGSGKSVSVLALLGILARAGRVTSGRADFGGQNLLALSDNQLRKIRGREIAMIFQDPMTSLNPVLTVERQVTEVLETESAELVAEYSDILQIGARNMQNFNLLAEVGRVPRPVLLKRAPSATVEELLMAAEYVAKEGNERVLLCERGIKTFERSTRYTLDLSAVPVLKRETHLPVIVDPSHAAGRSDLVLPLARAAVAAGADGVMIEVHPHPEDALCDGPQQIRVGEFARFADEIRTLVALMGKTVG